MSTAETVRTRYCRTCGEPIHAEAVICPECGVEQPKDRSGVASVSNAYPLWAWLAGVALTIFAFGWGLIALAYFVLKGTRDDFEGQSTAEIVTVLLLALLGIVIVEVGGESGTRRFWRVVAWLVGGLVVLGVVVAVFGMVLMLFG